MEKTNDEEGNDFAADQSGGIQSGEDHLRDPVLLLFQSAGEHLAGEQHEDEEEDDHEDQRRDHAHKSGFLPRQ